VHRLLERQLKRYLPGVEPLAAGLRDFLDAVNRAYEEADEERRVLERSLELTSEEFVDLSNRLRAELAARKRAAETLERQSMAIESSIDGIAICGADGRIVFANGAYARMHGYDSPAALAGENWTVFYGAGEIEAWERERMPAFLREGRWRGESFGRRRDGTTFPVEVTLARISEGWVCICRDMTERRRLEEKLLHSQKMETIGRFAGGVAHDFNNILTAILGTCDLAMLGIRENDPRRSDLEDIRRAAKRAADLTKRLLAFSRRQTFELRTLCLNDLLLDLDKMLRRLIGADVELVYALAPDLAHVRADPGQLEQVFVNLAINARDAMPRGGTLTISTANEKVDDETARRYGRPGGEYVAVAVSDTGAGMTEEVKAHLFEPFFTTKEIGKGTGLGLATCYGIIQQSEGFVAVESAPGAGTTFRIFFPRKEGESLPQAARDPSARLPRGKETVLLVEDEPTVRALAARILRAHGYVVVEAATGEEALRLIETGELRPEIIVSDVIMPQMGGKELLDRVSARFGRPRSILVSGYTDGVVIAPGTPFLPKPFTPEALLKKVREVLDTEPARA
jgi:PAS domain S-box-containing protein